MDPSIRPLTPEELTARIRVLYRERTQVTRDYEARHNHISDEIKQLTEMLNEIQARNDHNMPF